MQLRQIRLPKQLYITIKHWCRTHQLTLKTFYYEVMEWFLQKKSSTATSYLASYQNGHIVSLWLSDTHINKVKLLAKQHQVSDARVIYTAIMYYTKQHPLN